MIRDWKRVVLLLLLVLAVSLVACDGTGDEEEATASESVLAVDEPGAEIAGRAAAQDDDEGAEDGEPLLEACTYSQGYWKNHPEAWDVEQLTLGETTYDQNSLLEILQTAPRGDASYILAHQLIAAELNLENEAEMIDAIAQAQEWLANHPLGTDPEAAREEAIMLAETLDDYNNGLLVADACDEVEDDDEEIEDEEAFGDDEDEDEDNVNDEACTGANPHPHATDLANRYGVGYETIMDWFCEGYGFGEIEIAFNLADETGLSVTEIMETRADGLGWGQIRKELGAGPGLGRDKPNPGNGGNPPGQEKDKTGRGNNGNPPGRDKNKYNPGLGND